MSDVLIPNNSPIAVDIGFKVRIAYHPNPQENGIKVDEIIALEIINGFDTDTITFVTPTGQRGYDINLILEWTFKPVFVKVVNPSGILTV